MNRILLFTIIPLTLISCTNNSHKNKPKSEEVFVTKIESDGTKRFNFSITTEDNYNKRSGGKSSSMSGRGSGGKGGGRGSGSRGGGRNGGIGKGGGSERGNNEGRREKMLEKMKQNLYQKLKLTLFKTGYCNDGYIELDSIVIPGTAAIQGKCKDIAIDGDIIKFPNQK